MLHRVSSVKSLDPSAVASVTGGLLKLISPVLPAAYPGDLNAWYCPGAFDIASGTWQDCSGNGNTAALSGSGLVESRRAGHGATSEVLALSGTPSSAIAFGAIIKSEFTVCARSRGTHRGREGPDSAGQRELVSRPSC